MRTIIIQTKVADIQDNLSVIKDHLPNTFEQFNQLGIVKDGIYKKIEFCIESMYDICAVINSDLQLGIPQGDESIIDNLQQNQVLSHNLAETLKDMKGFRNILVHRYGHIDDEIAFTILSSQMDNFYQFIEEINSFLKDMNNKERN